MPGGSRWRRVVLKLSGEAFASAACDETIDGGVVERVAAEIAEARADLGGGLGHFAGEALHHLGVDRVLGGAAGEDLARQLEDDPAPAATDGRH